MQFDQLKRREFIRFLGGATVAWPLVARAQQPERMRRIGVLMSRAADDPQASRRSNSPEPFSLNTMNSNIRAIKAAQTGVVAGAIDSVRFWGLN
jgi:hypothetical protein